MLKIPFIYNSHHVIYWKCTGRIAWIGPIKGPQKLHANVNLMPQIHKIDRQNNENSYSIFDKGVNKKLLWNSFSFANCFYGNYFFMEMSVLIGTPWFQICFRISNATNLSYPCLYPTLTLTGVIGSLFPKHLLPID